MLMRKSVIALVGVSFVLAAPMTLATVEGAAAKTMMKMKKKAPKATENKQTKSGGQPGGRAGGS